MNPAEFEMVEDLSMLLHLNEASVLHTLRRRYDHWMIYVCISTLPGKSHLELILAMPQPLPVIFYI